MGMRKITSGDEYTTTPLVNDFKQTIDYENKCVNLQWVNPNGQIETKRVFRKNGGSTNRYIDAQDDFTYIGSTQNGELKDWTIGNNHKVHYQIEGSSSTSFYFNYSDEVTTDWEGWTIIGLTPVYSEGRIPEYETGEVWNFISDVESGEISRNINATAHVGTSAYAQTSRENTKYESGTFSASLFTVSCPDLEIVDDIYRVKRWMTFISNTDRFLLKSHKGDVWIISITGNPQRSYEEQTLDTLTTISYEWVEVDDVNNVIVR